MSYRRKGSGIKKQRYGRRHWRRKLGVCRAVCSALMVTFVRNCDYQKASASLKLWLLFFSFFFLKLWLLTPLQSQPSEQGGESASPKITASTSCFISTAVTWRKNTAFFTADVQTVLKINSQPHESWWMRSYQRVLSLRHASFHHIPISVTVNVCTRVKVMKIELWYIWPSKSAQLFPVTKIPESR